MEPMNPHKPIIPPPALRAARALLKLSQGEVCAHAKITDRSLRQAEGKSGAGEAVSQRLRRFYEDSGLRFLGYVDIGSGDIFCCGVRWEQPTSDQYGLGHPDVDTKLHSEFSFRAARALLGLSMDQVSQLAGLSKKTLIMLEADSPNSEISTRSRMIDFYESQGLIFLGQRTSTAREFIGVGVQIAESRPVSGNR